MGPGLSVAFGCGVTDSPRGRVRVGVAAVSPLLGKIFRRSFCWRHCFLTFLIRLGIKTIKYVPVGRQNFALEKKFGEERGAGNDDHAENHGEGAEGEALLVGFVVEVGVLDDGGDAEHLDPPQDSEEEADAIAAERAVGVGLWQVDDSHQLREQNDVDKVRTHDPQVKYRVDAQGKGHGQHSHRRNGRLQSLLHLVFLRLNNQVTSLRELNVEQRMVFVHLWPDDDLVYVACEHGAGGEERAVGG